MCSSMTPAISNRFFLVARKRAMSECDFATMIVWPILKYESDLHSCREGMILGLGSYRWSRLLRNLYKFFPWNKKIFLVRQRRCLWSSKLFTRPGATGYCGDPQLVATPMIWTNMTLHGNSLCLPTWPSGPPLPLGILLLVWRLYMLRLLTFLACFFCKHMFAYFIWFACRPTSKFLLRSWGLFSRIIFSCAMSRCLAILGSNGIVLEDVTFLNVMYKKALTQHNSHWMFSYPAWLASVLMNAWVSFPSTLKCLSSALQ